MADENTDGAIRPEVVERLKRELSEANTKVEQLSAAVTDFKFVDDAYRHFKAKEGVKDPYALASQAVRDVTLKGVEREQLGEKLDSWMLDVQSLFATPTTDGAPANEPPVVDATPVPEFGKPNPAADGVTPGISRQKIATDSDEFKNLVQAGNKAEIERLDKEGLIAWKSQTPTR